MRCATSGRIPKGDTQVPKREIELLNILMDKVSAEEFEAEKYHDEYRERFLAFVGSKDQGQRNHGRIISTRAAREGCEFNGSVETEPGGSSAATAGYTSTCGEPRPRKRRKA